MRNKSHRGKSIFLTCFVVLSGIGHEIPTVSASTSEASNEQAYGNCFVFDEVNLLTDEVNYTFTCAEQGIWLSSATMMIFSHFPDRAQAVMAFSTGAYLSDGLVDVIIRVDKGRLIKRSWSTYELNSSYYAFSTDQALISSLLEEIAMGNRIVIQVGDKGGSIVLNGSAAAISDYESRIARHR